MTGPLRLLAQDLRFPESPRWREGRLWFSDVYDSRVMSVSLAGDLRTELEMDDFPSGLGWMPDGSLLVVSSTKRRLLRLHRGQLSMHADLTGIAQNVCNDMVVSRTGYAYVGNCGFDLDAERRRRGIRSVLADHPTADLAFVAPSGDVSVAACGLHYPNGSVITPDGKTLIIAETLGNSLTAFTIGDTGGLSDRRVWARVFPRFPDGITLDAGGRIWMANPAYSECVLLAEGGKTTDTIATTDACYACMLGGDDGRQLFVLTAKTSDAQEAAGSRTGKVWTTSVDLPHAGLP